MCLEVEVHMLKLSIDYMLGQRHVSFILFVEVTNHSV